jgi:aldehyde dehydrogenase (NAD+)
MSSPHDEFRTDLDKQFIDGAWRDGQHDKRLTDVNPYDGTTVTEFAMADVADVDLAYTAAKTAQAQWAQVNPYQQRTVFERAVRYVEDHTDEITEVIIDELGGTRLKAAFEIGLVIDILKEAATFPLRMEGRILPSPLPDKENRVYRLPVGVVGVISPFNFPFFLSMKSVAPALAAGNGVVLKPHEDTDHGRHRDRPDLLRGRTARGCAQRRGHRHPHHR